MRKRIRIGGNDGVYSFCDVLYPQCNMCPKREVVMEFVWVLIQCIAISSSTCDPYNDGVGTIIVFKTKEACEKEIEKLPKEFTGEHSGRKFRRVWGCHKTEVRK